MCRRFDPGSVHFSFSPPNRLHRRLDHLERFTIATRALPPSRALFWASLPLLLKSGPFASFLPAAPIVLFSRIRYQLSLLIWAAEQECEGCPISGK